MARSSTIALFKDFLCAAIVCVVCLPAFGQTPTEIQLLANRTAEHVTKTHQQHIFVAGLEGCQLDVEVCTMFEGSVRAYLEKAIPGVHFVNRDNVIKILEGRGFLAMDAYIPDIVKAVAMSAGADILVTDSLEWLSDSYGLNVEVYDAVQGKKLDQFRSKIARPGPDTGGEPLVFTDLESGVSLLIPRGKQSPRPVVDYPKCVRCPDATYTPEARADRIQGRVDLLATVTVQGMAEHIGIISGLGDGLTDQALETIRSWRFKPAVGTDGKPIATRVPIEVTFLLQ